MIIGGGNVNVTDCQFCLFERAYFKQLFREESEFLPEISINVTNVWQYKGFENHHILKKSDTLFGVADNDIWH